MATSKITTGATATATSVVVPLLEHHGSTTTWSAWSELIAQSAKTAFPGDGECVKTGKLYVHPEPVLKVILPEPPLGENPSEQEMMDHLARAEKNRVNRKINDTLSTKHALDVANQPNVMKQIFQHVINSISKGSMEKIKSKAENHAGLDAEDVLKLMVMARISHN